MNCGLEGGGGALGAGVDCALGLEGGDPLEFLEVALVLPLLLLPPPF